MIENMALYSEFRATDYIDELAQKYQVKTQASSQVNDYKSFKDTLNSGLTLFKPRTSNPSDSLNYLLKDLANKEYIELDNAKYSLQ